MSQRIAATIISNNYLAHARVFARSFLTHNPGGKIYVAVVDEPHPDIDYSREPFETVFASELGIRNFYHFAFKYSILELNTAVKPSFLRYLHRNFGCNSLCYFDPDILVTADLAQLYDKLGQHGLVLTPHILEPINDRQPATPSELDLLSAGVFNLGFLGISFKADTLRLLDWWARKLYNGCLSRPDLSLFVDQKWMNFAPVFIPDTAILREHGYNVAYWNLMHNHIIHEADGWFTGTDRLRFFHFSGYDPAVPDRLSKHQNRIKFSDRPDIVSLFELYRSLLAKEGHQQTQKVAYAYSSFDNGALIPLPARQVLQLVDPNGTRWENPFKTDGGSSFYSWLQTSVTSHSRIQVTRLALGLWDQRGDLQIAFPSPTGQHAEAFAEWFTEGPECQANIDPLFRDTVRNSLLRARPEASVSRDLEAPDQANVLAEDGDLEHRWPRIPRAAMQIHRQRPDLIDRFPDPFGENREEFAFWYITHGRDEYHVPISLISSTARSLPLRLKIKAAGWWIRRLFVGQEKPPQTATMPPSFAAGRQETVIERQGIRRPETRGVSIIGWADAPTGVGQACRGSLRALEEASLPTSVEVLPHGNHFSRRITGIDYEVLLYHVNADMMPVIRNLSPVSRLARFQIGYWFWELSHFPLSFQESFTGLDEVWAPTEFCQQAYMSIAPVPVRLVPPCVIPPKGEPTDRSNWGISKDAFLFLTVFDALSFPERKNPWGTISAFRNLIEANPAVKAHLLIKVNQASPTSEVVQRLKTLVKNLPVTLVTDSYCRTEMDNLLASCDAYVSLHRSEGLGLPLIEAMFCGKPVVGTAYGGCVDFLKEETAWPVAYRLVAIDRQVGPYPAGAVWAEPDVDDATRQMARVLECPGRAAQKATAARQLVKELYSPEYAAERFRHEFDRVFQLVEGGNKNGQVEGVGAPNPSDGS